MTTPTLKLYYSPTCGYCHWVIRAAEELGIPLELSDIRRDPAALPRLIASRGRGTVPVLSITGEDGERLLGESKDIIAYLRELAANDAA